MFASTFEEARTNDLWNGGYHNFTFVDSSTLPTITSVAESQDGTEEAWVVTVTVDASVPITDTLTNFDGIMVGGYKQETLSITAT